MYSLQWRFPRASVENLWWPTSQEDENRLPEPSKKQKRLWELKCEGDIAESQLRADLDEQLDGVVDKWLPLNGRDGKKV